MALESNNNNNLDEIQKIMPNKTKHGDRSFTASYDLMVKHGKKKKRLLFGFGKKYHITRAHLKIRYLEENWFMFLVLLRLRQFLAWMPFEDHSQAYLNLTSYFTDLPLILVVIRFDSLNWKRRLPGITLV